MYHRVVALNIRNPHTLDALRQLAAMTHSPMTVALDQAVTERLAQLRRDREEQRTRLVAICADAARRWPAAGRTGDPTADLYDDSGIPA